jgi:hypothetical protein
MIGPAISASGTTQILVATKPVDFRNYAQRTIMLSRGGMLRPAAGFSSISLRIFRRAPGRAQHGHELVRCAEAAGF